MTSPAQPARVVVVDDQVLLREGIAALIDAAPEFEVVGRAADGEDALDQVARLEPDLVVMDIRMPRLDGVAATRRIRERATDDTPRIVILTMYDLDEYVFAAVRAGASAFLLKDTPPVRLLNALRTVLAGDALFAPAVIRRLVETYAAADTVPAEPPPALDRLTARETEVLRWVATGLSNAAIAERLVVSEATMKTHLHRAMTKLGLSSRAQAVVLAYETGLVVPGGQDQSVHLTFVVPR